MELERKGSQYKWGHWIYMLNVFYKNEGIHMKVLSIFSSAS